MKQYEFRITYGYGRDRAARIISAVDVSAAILDARAGCRDASIFNVSVRCGGTTKDGGKCERWTTLNRCPSHSAEGR